MASFGISYNSLSVCCNSVQKQKTCECICCMYGVCSIRVYFVEHCNCTLYIH